MWVCEPDVKKIDQVDGVYLTEFAESTDQNGQSRANTTAEMLAQYLAGRVRQELARGGVSTIDALELEVEESFGQSATYREALWV